MAALGAAGRGKPSSASRPSAATGMHDASADGDVGAGLTGIAGQAVSSSGLFEGANAGERMLLGPGRVALIDLDGTLTDPYPGISRSIFHAMERLGRPLKPDTDLSWCIGPPLSTAFRTLLETEDEGLIAEAVAAYRERYGTVGLYENTLYPGIEAALDALVADGVTLMLATSKVRAFAVRILEHFGLASRFGAIHGSEFDGTRADKGELIRYIVTTEGIAAASKVMVGDRYHDVAGAAVNGIPTVGAGWGFGGREELIRAGARCVVEAVAELPVAIGDVLAE